MGNGIRIGRIAGIDILMDWSLLIIFLLISFSLSAVQFPLWHPEWNSITAWLTGVAAAILFFGSVLAHELSHALVGRARGIEVRRITLFIFGGMAQMENEPRGWRAEFWMAIVGPCTSLVLGVAFLVLAGVMTEPMEVDPDNPIAALAQLSPAATLLMWLGPVNILLGLFNLVPGFPLDGGRILRAIMWAITSDFRKATLWASRGGQGFAWLLILAGVSMALGLHVPIFGTGLVGGLWLAFIGWFLNNAALMSYRQVLVREALTDVPVRKLMRTEVQTLRPGLTIEQFVDDHFAKSDQRAFPVVEDDRLVGLVCLGDIRKHPREQWSAISMDSLMKPASELMVVGPDEDATEALHRLSRQDVNQLPVVADGQLLGMIQRQNILSWLSVYAGDKLESLAD